jgi:hypothetical protein
VPQKEIHAPRQTVVDDRDGFREALKPFCDLLSDGLFDLPDGQITEFPVQSHLQKYSASPQTQIKFISPLSRPTEGRLAIVTDAGRDAVDADGAFDEWRLMWTAKACGPDAPTLASSSRKATFADDGGKQARSPGRARSNPLKPLRGECRVFPV